MTVARILKQKGSTAVETIGAGATVGDAVARLSQKGIGALIVSEDGETVAGIISERDVVRELGHEGPSCLGKLVGDVMTRQVKTCKPDEKAVSVLQRMTAGRFRHMPVIENDRLAGVISIGDVVKMRISELEHETEALSDMIKGF